MHPDPATVGPPVVTSGHRKTLRNAIEAACDANDGGNGWGSWLTGAPSTVPGVVPSAALLARDPQAGDDVRLFMMPGVLHCAGSDGASFVDWVGEIDRWHTTGKAPDQIVARFRPGDTSEGRPLCAWPASQHYAGGDGRQPDSFACQ